jgi:hypothetical protein
MKSWLTIDDIPVPLENRRFFEHDFSLIRGLPLTNVFGWRVAVMIWRPAEETTWGSTGIKRIVAPETIREYELQGRCGLVLSLGRDAYGGDFGDHKRFPNGAWVKVGDIIRWLPAESQISRYSFGLPERYVMLADITDDAICGDCADPSLVGAR